MQHWFTVQKYLAGDREAKARQEETGDLFIK